MSWATSDPGMVEAIAAELVFRLENGEPFEDLAARLPTMADAYAVQDAFVDRLARHPRTEIGGHKAAVLTKAVQARLKVDEPCAGQVLASRMFSAPHTLTLRDFRAMAVEPEICVVLDRDLDGGCGVDDVRRGVRSVHCAFEIVDERGADPATLNGVTLVAGNCANWGIVLGPSVGGAPDLADLSGSVTVNGQTLWASPTGHTAEAGPYHVVAWLAALLARRGKMLKAGQAIVTGTIVRTYAPVAGDRVCFEIDGLTPVEISAAP